MKMSSVAVFVFLLDNLTGFNDALNDTLFQNAKYIHSDEASPVIRDCDTAIADQILSAVSQDVDLVREPSIRNDNEQSDEQASEIFGRVLVDNSLPEPDVSRSFDENKSKFDNDLTLSSRSSIGGSRNTENVTLKDKNEEITKFPNSAPFLVAIFETLANVTAQTCAGTLLNSRWVLTAANCINVLSTLHVNTTNMTETSHYTIVAESSNPLLDGSAHNVTSVVLHHATNLSRRPVEEEEDRNGSYVALMRIEPEVESPALELMKEELENGDVMAYGWMLSAKNDSDSDHDAMECSSALSEILSPAKCQTKYSYKANEVLCLLSKDVDKNATQLSTGGPVLVLHEGNVKILAVLQTDDDVFVSYPVAPHHDWILHTISNK